MATYTENLSLKKPAGTDIYNIEDFNENSDIVDAHAGTMANAERIGHVKISDSIIGTNKASTGIVASEYSVGFLRKIAKGLNGLTWDEILDIGDDMSIYFNIGEEKDVILTNGTKIVLVIVGFNHDELTDGGMANVSFISKDCVRYSKMNETDTSAGGWSTSYLRNTQIPIMYDLLPSDLQAAMKFVNKKTNLGTPDNKLNEVETTQDKLWIPGANELGLGSSAHGIDPLINETPQYPIFIDRISRIKNSNSSSSASSTEYWSRSPSGVYDNRFMICNTSNSPYFSANGQPSFGEYFPIGLCI